MKDKLKSKESSIAGHDLIKKSLDSGKAIADDDKKSWDLLVDYFESENYQVIALRGAGSINGIEKDEADKILRSDLIPRIDKLIRAGRKVVMMYDGDQDSLDKPDIGYIAGRLLDHFGNSPNKLLFITAQKRSWYYPQAEGGNLNNVKQKQFVTYVFDNDKYEGDHNQFTQDSRLVEADGYEQWYIGASGDIATSQLADFNNKVSDGQRRVATIFRLKNNSKLDEEIRQKLNVAEGVNVAKFERQLAQRQRIYGTHWDNEGNSTIEDDDYNKLDLIRVV